MLIYTCDLYRSPHGKRDKKAEAPNPATPTVAGQAPPADSQTPRNPARPQRKHPRAQKNDESSLEAAKAVQEKIEAEQKKRKEGLEAWRQERQKEEEQQQNSQEGGEEGEGEDGEEKQKGWALEDEDEDEEETTVPMDDETAGDTENGTEATNVKDAAEELVDEDVDPLDAFMVGVQEEVKEISTAFQKKIGTGEF